MKPARRFSRVRGMSLIDVLLVIVLLGVVASALMTLSGKLASESAAALRTRQTLAIAQALLTEVSHMPFTFCDPNDANALTATSAAGCASTVDAMGPEPGETRYNPANRFDGVSDYQGFTMPGPGCPTGLCNLSGTVINGPGSSLTGCSAGVQLFPQAIASVPPIAALDGNGRPQVLRISVSVTCPGSPPLVLEGVRMRHAPNWF
jgi:MSHA pilin protein MshD